MPNEPKARQFTLRPSQRLRGSSAFAPVFDSNVRKPAGPITLLGKPNNLAWSRLGITASRKVGNAVQRHRVKRRLREAYRLEQHALPAGYDYVVIVHRHEPLAVARYRQLLVTAGRRIARTWDKRQGRESAGE